MSGGGEDDVPYDCPTDLETWICSKLMGTENSESKEIEVQTHVVEALNSFVDTVKNNYAGGEIESLATQFDEDCQVLSQTLRSKTFLLAREPFCYGGAGSFPTVHDVRLSAYGLLLRRKLSTSRLHDLFMRRTNLRAYVDRFLAKHVLPRAISIPVRDFEMFLELDPKPGVLLGTGATGEVRQVMIPVGNLLNLQSGEYAFKFGKENCYDFILGECQTMFILGTYPHILKMDAYCMSEESTRDKSKDSNARAVLILSLIRGCDLEELMKRDDLSWGHRVKIIKGVAYAMHCLLCHDDKQGFVYGDFKENNLLIDEETMEATLIDLGIVQEPGEVRRMVANVYTRLLGSVQYMMSDTNIDSSDGSYLIGVLIFKLITNMGPDMTKMLPSLLRDGHHALWRCHLDIICDAIRGQCSDKQATDILDLALECLYTTCRKGEVYIPLYEIHDRLDAIERSI